MSHLPRGWQTRKGARRHHANTLELLARWRSHIDYVSGELRTFYRNRDNVILDSTSYCFTIVDGADQWAPGFPHLVSMTKNKPGHYLTPRPNSLLERNKNNYLHLYKMVEENETGSNHVIQVLHRFPQSWSEFCSIVTSSSCIDGQRHF